MVAARRRASLMLALALCCLLAESCSTTRKRHEATGASGEIAGPTGDLSIENETWDFGSIKRGEKATRTMAVTNGGEDALVITARSTCDCLTARLEVETLPSGAATDLRLSFLGEDISERVTKTVYVQATEPHADRITLTVTGRVTRGDGPHLEALPTMLLFEKSGEAYEPALLRIINRGRADLDVADIRCFGCVAGGGGFTLRADEETEIEVGLADGWTETRWLEVDSNDPIAPTKKIPLVVLE
jgi:hypothetical protein